MKRISFTSFLFLLALLLNLSFTAGLLAQTAAVNDNLTLGNPSAAKTDLNQPDNYLVVHNGYSLSYNKSRGAANWVAWHLEKSDIGDVDRTNAFAPDTTLPREWWIVPADYSISGYDRGHLLPSKDRSASEESNRVTFLMSNMQPQSPKLNQKTWRYLEDYTREIVKNNEAYVYAGCYGEAGKIKDKITIPTNCWKIIVVLPVGDDDLKRIDNKTRIIAVDMPNDETVSVRWRTYLTTVDDIEKKTGFDFLSLVPKKIQSVIEATKDTSLDAGETGVDNTTGDKSTDKSTTKKTDSGDRVYMMGTKGGCYYLTASGKKSYVDKKFCENAPAASDSKEKKEIKHVPEQPKALPDKKTAPGKSSSDERTYIKGERGGCYYINSSGKKTYVDKEKCNQ